MCSTLMSTIVRQMSDSHDTEQAQQCIHTICWTACRLPMHHIGTMPKIQDNTVHHSLRCYVYAWPYTCTTIFIHTFIFIYTETVSTSEVPTISGTDSNGLTESIFSNSTADGVFNGTINGVSLSLTQASKVNVIVSLCVALGLMTYYK